MAAVRHRLDSTRQLWLPLSNAIAPRPPGLERENPQTALLAIGVEELHRRFLRRNLQLLRDVCAATDRPVVASGGVSSLEDLRAIAGVAGVEGAIVGKALYAGAFTLPEALAAVR